jgi:Concanavalin A-like lectin/glucanases superfamily
MLLRVKLHRASVLCTAAFLAALFVPGSASAASYDFPLSGYWPLNEGKGQVARDWSGNGNHGQLGSTPGVDANDPSWIKGAFFWSYGLHFDGGEFVTIPDSSDLEPQQLTVSTWFRNSGSPGQFKYLVAKGSNQCESSSYGLYTGQNSGLLFYVSDGTETGVTISADAGQGVWDGKWHNASGTFDGSTVRLFIDGKEIGSGTPRGGAPIGYGTPAGNTTLGAYGGTCDLSLTGDLDEVSIWKKALPVAEIWKKASIFFAPH